ncbi:MAG: hypothetical protein WA080_09675 [Sulfuricurvum sp.]
MENNRNIEFNKMTIIKKFIYVIVGLVLMYAINFLYTHTLPGNTISNKPVQTFIFNEIQYDISSLTDWKLFDGFITMYYKNGKIKEVTNFRNGKREGLRKLWYENGQIEYEIPFENNQVNGILRQWYSNGKKKSISNHVNGKLAGMSYVWYENGQLGIEIEYYQNNTIGIHRKWDQDGKLIFDNNSSINTNK